MKEEILIRQQMLVVQCLELGITITLSDTIDWIKGEETLEDIKGYAREFRDEEHVVNCENKDAWMYEL